MSRDILVDSISPRMLWNCLLLGLTADQTLDAVRAGHYVYRAENKALARYVFLRSKDLPYIAQYDDQLRITADPFYSKDLPDHEELVSVSHEEACEILSSHIDFRAYFCARKLLSHTEIFDAYKMGSHVDLAGYAKLRKKFKMTHEFVQELVEEGVQLGPYCELIELLLNKPEFDKAMELFGKSLKQFIIAVKTHGLTPELIIARAQEPGGFDIFVYNNLRSRIRLSDEETMQAMRDPELLAVINS